MDETKNAFKFIEHLQLYEPERNFIQHIKPQRSIFTELYISAHPNQDFNIPAQDFQQYLTIQDNAIAKWREEQGPIRLYEWRRSIRDEASPLVRNALQHITHVELETNNKRDILLNDIENIVRDIYQGIHKQAWIEALQANTILARALWRQNKNHELEQRLNSYTGKFRLINIDLARGPEATHTLQLFENEFTQNIASQYPGHFPTTE